MILSKFDKLLLLIDLCDSYGHIKVLKHSVGAILTELKNVSTTKIPLFLHFDNDLFHDTQYSADDRWSTYLIF